MNHFKAAYFVSTLFYAAILSLVSSCVYKTDTITEQSTLEDYTVGEQWTWKWQRSVNGKVQARGKDYKEVVNYKSTLGFYYGGTDTLEIAKILDRKPSKASRYRWPLEVGKKWKYEVEWKNNEGTSGKTSQDAEVLSFEEFTVDGGKFMAYKIEFKGRITNSRGFDGKLVDVWWYAPALKSYIKHTQDDGEGLYINELISYSK